MAQALKQQTPDTRQRILAAAIRCVQQWGIEKTSLNDIAKEAGVTRPTVYSYFPSREAVVQAALLESGYAFADRAKRHMARWDNAADRVLETVMFAWHELPNEPYLALVTKGNLAEMVNETALTSEEGQAICLDIFLAALESRPDLHPEIDEIIEITTRLLLSLLLIASPTPRGENAMRDFLRRRLLPAIGLAPTASAGAADGPSG